MRQGDQNSICPKTDFEMIFQDNPAPMFIWEFGTGKFLECNKAALSLYGYEKNEFIGMNVKDIRPPGETFKIEKLISSEENFLSDGLNGHQGYWLHQKKDGQIIYVEIKAHIFNYNGINACMAVVNDITQSKKTEDALKISENEYKKLFNSGPLPKWIYDPDTFKILNVNSSAISHYGYSKEEFLDLTLLDLRPKEEVPKLYEAIKKRKENGENTNLGIFTHLKKDGTRIKVEITSQGVEYLGKCCRMVACLDVTLKERQQKMDRLEMDLFEKSLSNVTAVQQTLHEYLTGLEELFPGMMASVLEIGNGKVYSFASPSLPKTYLEAINGSKIGPKAGSCGTAAFIREKVVVSDIKKDPLWEDYRELALSHQLMSCWSHPIFNSKDEVIATVAYYHKTVGSPSLEELDLMGRSASLISLILENYQKSKEINSSNERYTYVSLATKDAIFDWNTDQDKLLLGKGFEKLFGYPPSSFPEKLSQKEVLIHPDDLSYVKSSLNNFFANADTENWKERYRLKKSNGEYAFVEERAYAVRNHSGQLIRLIGVFSDITKETLEQQQLRMAESVVKNTSDAVVILDAGIKDKSVPKIIYSNEAFTKMTGYLLEEIIGKPIQDILCSTHIYDELQNLNVLMEKAKPFESTLVCCKKNGEEFWNSLSANPVTDESGNISQWIFIQRDITQNQNELIQKSLLTELGAIFNKNEDLHTTFNLVLKHLGDFGEFYFSEAWLISTDKKSLHLISSTQKSNKYDVFNSKQKIDKFHYGEGLPGTVWKNGKSIVWENIDEHPGFVRKEGAKTAGIKKALGIPLTFNKEVVGVLLFAVGQNHSKFATFISLLGQFETFLGSELRRKQMEQQLGRIFDTSPDIICIAGVDGYFKKINPAAVELLGYPEKELLDHPYLKFIHPEDKNAFRIEWEKLHETKKISYFEIRVITNSGKTIWLSWSATFSVEEGLIYAVAKNISEQKELQELLKNATNLSRIGAWEVDLLSQQTIWSPMTREIHEIDHVETPSLEESLKFYPPKYQTMVTDALQKSIDDGKPFQFESPIITAKGNKKWIRAIGKPEFKEGKCIRLSGSFQDIHIQKMDEINLTKSLQLINDYKKAIDQSFNVTLTDLEGVILEVNDHTCILSGYTREELVGTHSRINKSGYHDKSFYKDMWQTISKGQIWRGDLKNKTKQGTYYWVDTIIAPLKDEKGKIKHYMAIRIDITEKKAAEESLKNLNENLLQQARILEISNAELEQFAYIASHDLQEPLRMVSSFLTLLEKKYGSVLDEKALKYISFAVDGSKRMRQIILDLLDYSRVGKEISEPQTLDLNMLVKEVILLQKKIIHEKGAIIRTKNLPTLTTDAAPLIQALNNLVNNALKYARPEVKPEIEIYGEEHPDEWVIAVKDNGIGIEKEYYDKIFILFQRLHNKTEYNGTGIGLSIVKKTIENLGGKIWVDSEVGKGSTFTFTMPK
jgi:PAS domain S-box-containing protein